MEYLAPPLNAVLQVKLKLKSGFSVLSALKSYTQDFSHCPFARQVNLWLICQETGQDFCAEELKSFHYRKVLLDLFLRGLKGESILIFLQEMEEELNLICHQELERHNQKLPFQALIPLFLFQVPAFFLLLLGPLLLELQNSFNLN